MKNITYLFFLLGLPIIIFISLTIKNKVNSKSSFYLGKKIDSLNGIFVYYNGSINNTVGRNITKDGYNLGLKYQCVEFVKRYYYERLNHKMPYSYGNANSFFDYNVEDGHLNSKRNLTQFTNPSLSKPKIEDLIVFRGTIFNKYGHVAIISNVTENYIEIIQQNSGFFGDSREKFKLFQRLGKWEIENNRIIGWLRKK